MEAPTTPSRPSSRSGENVNWHSAEFVATNDYGSDHSTETHSRSLFLLSFKEKNVLTSLAGRQLVVTHFSQQQHAYPAQRDGTTGLV